MIPNIPRNPRYAIIGLRPSDHRAVADDKFLSEWLGMGISDILPNRRDTNARLPSALYGMRGWLVQSTFGRMDLRRAEWYGWQTSTMDSAALMAHCELNRYNAIVESASLAKLNIGDFYGFMVLCNTVTVTGATRGTHLIARLIRQDGQRTWRCCNGCNTLAFDRAGGSGRCPSGNGMGTHTFPAGWNAYLPYFNTVTVQRIGQPTQIVGCWCRSCEQMWSKDGSWAGVCPVGGGGHSEESSGGRYALKLYSTSTDAKGYQRGWGVCKACRAIAYFGNPPNASGVCPAGSLSGTRAHTPVAGLELAVPTEFSSSRFFMAHELGHTLDLQHMYSNALIRMNSSDSCAGAYGDSGDVMGYEPYNIPADRPQPMPYSVAGALVQGWVPESKVVRHSWSPGQTVEVTLGDPMSNDTSPHLLVLRAPNATYGVELEVVPATYWSETSDLLQVRRYHQNFAAGRASFMPCTACGAVFDVPDRVCAAGGVHFTPDRGVHSVAHGAATGADWRWCRRCSMLWRPGVGAKGCPAGGEHTSEGSGQYALTYNQAGGPLRQCTSCGVVTVSGKDSNGDGCTHGAHTYSSGGLTANGVQWQDGWRTCGRCAGVVFTGELACPRGGAHKFSDPSSGLGGLRFSLESTTGDYMRQFWVCVACKGLTSKDGVCIHGGAHRRDTSLPLFRPPEWVPREIFCPCTKCQTMVRQPTAADSTTATSPICGAGGDHSYPSGGANYLFRVASVPSLSQIEHPVFPCCGRCGGLYDPDNTGASCPAGGRHSVRGYYSLTRNRWTLPFPSMLACASCGLIHPMHADPNATKACLGTSTHRDQYNGQAIFFGWSAFVTEGQLHAWSDCTRCGLLVHNDHGFNSCAAGGEHHTSGTLYDPNERRTEWGLVRMATAVSTQAPIDRTASGDRDRFTVELRRIGGINTVRVR